MAEPLKYMFNKNVIEKIAQSINSVYESFDSQSFNKAVLNDNWDNLELKDRVNHISRSLHEYLPEDYEESISILKEVSKNFDGFVHMFFPTIVEIYGLDYYDISIDALEYFTRFSSSEFAVRPFIKKYPQKMMRQMEQWAESENLHVRRLASEGCRPRLPWAMSLPEFKKDPSPILPILEKLKNDESEYVRRSVANNLNDISKDHRDLIVKISRKWLGDNENTNRLIKHACRSLLKNGDKEVLLLFGFTDPRHITLSDFKLQDSVVMGEQLSFSFSLLSNTDDLGQIRIEYAIDFMKNNGRQARKVFKISEANYTGNSKFVQKNHSFRKISTRVYYPGEHGLTIIINGVEFCHGTFTLKPFL